MPTATMTAVRMHRRGGPEVLHLETVPVPEPGVGEVLIRVLAATVNHTDLFHRSGRFHIQKPLPHTLGMDVAGEIAGVGDGVADWRLGDRVVATFEALGRERDGAYADYTVVPQVELRRIPNGLDTVAAASIGLAFTTAWTALLHTGGLGDADERVVVHAASSGVGSAALQIARWKGAQVIAVSEPPKAARLQALGAAVVVDRGASDLVAPVMDATGGRGASLVLDLVGRCSLAASVAMLADRGRVVCAGTLSGDRAELDVMDLIMKHGSVRGSFDAISAADFDTILARFADHSFEPVIDCVLDLRQAREAHERIEAKANFGKVVLVPGLSR